MSAPNGTAPETITPQGDAPISESADLVLGTAKPRLLTRITAFLGFGGAIALLAAIALSLFTGCGPAPIPAVTLKLVRSPETPRDASVIIDEEYIGPLGIVAARGVRIPLGEHRISIEKTGYFPYDQLVVSDRDDVTLKVKLERVPD
jgi:hypothetical protein